MIEAAVRPLLFHHYPILRGIPSPLIDRALEEADLVKIPAGTLMWDETFKIQTFPFVIKGSGRVIKLSSAGRELHLYTVGPGDGCVIASNSLLSDSPSNARAIANDDMEMVKLPVSTFKNLMRESETFRNYVVADLSETLNLLTELVSAVVFQKLDQRLAASLIAKPSPIQKTHQTIADELGSVREIISRLLKNFADLGWISLQRGQITVLKPRELKEFAHQI